MALFIDGNLLLFLLLSLIVRRARTGILDGQLTRLFSIRVFTLYPLLFHAEFTVGGADLRNFAWAILGEPWRNTCALGFNNLLLLLARWLIISRWFRRD